VSATAEPAPAVLEWGQSGAAELRWWQRIDPRLPRLFAGLAVVALTGSVAGEWQVTTINIIQIEPVTESMAVRFADTGAWGTGWLVGALLLLGCAGPALYGPAGVRPAARSAGLALAVGLRALLLGAASELSRFSLLDRGFGFGGPDQGVEVTLGRGVYAAFATAALFAVALALSAVRPLPGHPAAGPVPATGADAPGAGTAVPAAVPPAGASAGLVAEPGIVPEPGGGAPGPGEASPGAPDRSSAAAPPAAPYGGPDDLTVGPAEPFAQPTDGHEWR
jgi:hypothetical protein